MAERPRRLARVFFALAIVYAIGVAIFTLWLRRFGDGHAVSAVIVYGPRWPALVPGLALVLAGLAIRAWRPLVVAAAATVVAFFAYLDFNVPLAFGAERGEPLRVVTYNIAQRDLTTPWLATFLRQEAPDVLALVECRPPDAFAAPDPDYHFDKSYGLCLLSRFPITRVDARDQRDAFDRGGTAAITLFTLEPPEAPSFQVMVVHLASPRGAIEPLIHARLDGLAEAGQHMELRDWEAGLARAWLDRADRPAIVVGDFNLTEESTIFRRHFGHLTSAFARCGLGFGNTKHTRKFGSRIDHILLTEAFDCADAEVLPIDGSDHRPLAASLSLAQ